ncbi:hypothetical protein LTR09_012336 [Extremus antarcticus]|uniref:Uncharacterized protein n=1 Tax=Extremus antarcticus TaxID=702011 RepID=A0AAJ0D587_9PEZI|nr:hypothetical protein LTR09_012336 [Extremus antarcticus]
MALHQSPPNRTSAEPPSDETISIRVSSRPPKPRKFPEDYLGEGVVYFGEDGRPEPTAKRQAEPPVEQPPLKRRGRPRKRAQDDTENPHGSSPDHQSPRSSMLRVPPTKNSFGKNSSTTSWPSTSAAIVPSPLVKELGNAICETADTRPQDRSSVPPRSNRSGLEDCPSPEDNESNAQALPANTQPLARAVTPPEPGSKDDNASTTVTVPTAGLPLYKTPQDFQTNDSQTPHDGTSYHRAAIVEGVMQGPGTLESLTASTVLMDAQSDGCTQIDAVNQHRHQRSHDELIQLGLQLSEFHTLLDLQSQRKTDIANRSKELDQEERELQALKKQVSCTEEDVALRRSELGDLREALKQRYAEIEHKKKNLRLD